MKKILLILAMTPMLYAFSLDPYVTPYIDMLRGEALVYQQSMNDVAAGLMAISSIDFTQSQGLSLGLGVGTFESYIDTSYAGALGVQYGFEDITINSKGWMVDSKNYAVGVGAIISF